MYGKIGCSLFYPLQTATVYASVFTLAALSCSRYIAIVHPYRANPTSFVAKCVLITIWVFSFLLVTPYIASLQLNDETGQCEETWTHSQAEVIIVDCIILVLVRMIFFL